MATKLTFREPNPAEFLADVFVTITEDGPRVDWRRALTGYVHHSSVPVAMAAYAADNPTAAKKLYPKLKLTQLVGKRPSMDGIEAQALAYLAGIDLPEELFWNGNRLREAFTAHLETVLERHGLWPCFYRSAIDHPGLMSIRPRGAQDDEAEGERDMAVFKAAIRQMTEVQRILVATVICLYRGEADTTWCKGRGWTWHAADAIAVLAEHDQARADWHRLVALYPGW